jgi:HSP20 family molecular chaperone IbpA
VSIERPWGAFERRFLLPAGCRASELKARISAGLLELRIPLDRSGVEREQKIDVD